MNLNFYAEFVAFDAEISFVMRIFQQTAADYERTKANKLNFYAYMRALRQQLRRINDTHVYF